MEDRSTLKYKVYAVFEHPYSSRTAVVVNAFIFLCILASTVTFVVQTMSDFTGPPYRMWWSRSEVFFVVVFSIEYILRWWSSPDTTRQFVLNPMNLIDLAAILPFFIEMFVQKFVNTGGQEVIDTRVLRVIRLARIFRLMKVGKYSLEIQILSRAVVRSWEAIFLLCCMLCSAMIVFGAIMFTLERGTWNAEMHCHVRKGDSACSPFESIPLSFYWGITTMTTVGYGDTYPITTPGKVLACATMICGIFIIALPVAVMGDRFVEAYQRVTDEISTEKLVTNAEDIDIHKKCQDVLEQYNEVFEKIRGKLPILKEQIGRSAVQMGRFPDEKKAHASLDPLFVIFAMSVENNHMDMKQFIERQQTPDTSQHGSSAMTPRSGPSTSIVAEPSGPPV